MENKRKVVYHVGVRYRSDEYFTIRASIPVSASDASSMLTGIGFKSPTKLWNEQHGVCERQTLCSSSMQHGIDTEDEALSYLEGLYPVGKVVLARDPPLAQRGKYGATADGFLWDPEHDTVCGVEIKCPDPRYSKQPYMDVPIKYIIQCYINMYVYGLNQWILFCYLKRDDDRPLYRMWRIPWVPEIFEKLDAMLEIFLKMKRAPTRGEMPGMKEWKQLELPVCWRECIVGANCSLV